MRFPIRFRRTDRPGCTISISRINTTNLGDLSSAPTNYFAFLEKSDRRDILDCKWVSERPVNIIFGGGGLLDNSYFDACWKFWLSQRAKHIIGWGLGHNQHGAKGHRYPEYLSRFSILGVRDFNDRPANSFWVPCPSCMDPNFDLSVPIVNDFVVYEHEHIPLPISEFPKLTNRIVNIAEAIRFLGSGNCILTNSYHGVYWATLLNRACVAFPFSSKFHSLRYPVPLGHAEEWRDLVNKARNFPESLGECRVANLRFAELVNNILND